MLGEYFQRLTNYHEIPFTPLPGRFPNEHEFSGTPTTQISFSYRLIKFLLYVPLTVVYYILYSIIFIMGVLKPIHKILNFYTKRHNSCNSYHSSQFQSIIESLSREITFNTDVNNDRSNEINYNFGSLYNLEDGFLMNQIVQGGYTNIIENCTEQGKFGMIYLHDPILYDSAEYLKNILCTKEFVNIVKKYQVLLWFSDVTRSEGLQVANTLKVRQFPFIGILTLKKDSKLEMIFRLEGKLFDYDINCMEGKLKHHYGELIQLRQQKQNRELERLLRMEQDVNYENSLRRDEERNRLREREIQMRAHQELEQQRKKKWLLWRKSQLFDEPQHSSNVCRLNIRIGDERIVRKFDASLPIEEIYAFVEIYRQGFLDNENYIQDFRPVEYQYEYPFSLVVPVPRFELDPTKIIRDEPSIYPSGTIVIESLE